jgi:hypothetical protein
VLLEPADAEELRDLVGRVPFQDTLDGKEPATLQFRRGAMGSHIRDCKDCGLGRILLFLLSIGVSQNDVVAALVEHNETGALQLADHLCDRVASDHAGMDLDENEGDALA